MKTLDDMTDSELSDELHRRRLNKRLALETELKSFSAQMILMLDQFEKMSGGLRIERGTYGGYRVVEPKK